MKVLSLRSDCDVACPWQVVAVVGNSVQKRYQHSLAGLEAFLLPLAPALFKVRSPHFVSASCAAEARLAVIR